ncbi:hypothetical protein BB8028_0002g11710 [Beauveria bassiana]|uniref:Uncharacterized protein n=1 Tax=Beauveria bassiana TaxID=176275 RepID=A0A2S7Y4Q8_BEABA|nr:hypothetical protein BB8028_0002g11710 [Beauveria bassiana]
MPSSTSSSQQPSKRSQYTIRVYYIYSKMSPEAFHRSFGNLSTILTPQHLPSDRIFRMAMSVIARIRIHPDRTGDVPGEKLARHERIKTSLVTLADHRFSWFQRGQWGDCLYALGQFKSLDEVYVDQESVENIIELGHC